MRRVFTGVAAVVALAIASIRLWLPLVEPPGLIYPVESAVVTPRLAASDEISLAALRCNATVGPIDFRVVRHFERDDGQRFEATSSVGRAENAGCVIAVARIDRLTDGLPPGRYRLVGEVYALGRWGVAEHAAPYRSGWFQIEAER